SSLGQQSWAAAAWENAKTETETAVRAARIAAIIVSSWCRRRFWVSASWCLSRWGALSARTISTRVPESNYGYAYRAAQKLLDKCVCEYIIGALLPDGTRTRGAQCLQ